MVKKLLSSKRNKIIASVVCVAIMLSAVAVGLAATFASSDLHVQFSDPNPGYIHVEAKATQPVTATNGYTWMSGNTATATVSYKTSNRPNATLNGVKAGTTVLSVGTKTGYVINLNVQVTDSNNITEYKISNNGEGYLNKSGDSMTIPITTTPAAVKNTLQWKSSNTSVATVDATGKITATTNMGATIISADVTDKWGVKQSINFVVAVGTKGIILGPDGNGDYYKELGDPKNVYEIVDKDGNPKTQPPTYVYDEDGNPLDGNSKPAEKTDDGKYYVEDPDGSNIWKEVESDGTLKDTPAIWGGNDKKPGGGDDKTAVKGDDGKYYVEDPDGSNLWKEVGTDGKLKDSPVTWGGEDKKPGNADDKTATKGDDGKWYVEDPTNIWWQVGSDGNLASTPIWGGADKKPGSADDKPAVKGTDGKYYTEVEDGINIWQPVDGNGNLVNSGYVGGGANKVPTPAIPAEKVDDVWYVGPFGEDDHYWSVGADGKSQSDANGNNGSDDKKNWKGSDGKMTDTDPSQVGTVTGIEVTPTSATIAKGGSKTFTAKVTYSDGFVDDNSEEVIWSVSGQSSENTKFTKGKLTIGSDETAVYLTVTVKSTEDTRRKATATVVVGVEAEGYPDIPISVGGRVISAEEAGDTSAWVEIAVKDGHSLLIRQTTLGSGDAADNYATLTVDDTRSIRGKINNWYGNLSPATKLRQYAVTNNAITKIGRFSTTTDDAHYYVGGYSNPSGTLAGSTVNDVSFPLSYQEAVQFCSKQFYAGAGMSFTLGNSWSPAPENFEKLDVGNLTSNYNFLYLRSTPPSSIYGACPIIKSNGLVHYASWKTSTGSYPQYIYPAMWVDSAIFD